MYNSQLDFDLQIIARGLGLDVGDLRRGMAAAYVAVLAEKDRADLAEVRPLHPHGLKAMWGHLPHLHGHREVA